jgi:fructokinase
MTMNLYGGIEAGGTKFVCAVGDDFGNVKDECVVKTTVPEETLPQVVDFFKKHKDIKSIGIGSFGPIETNSKAKKYGFILHTPKQAWIDCDFLGYIKKALNIPVGFYTDVDAAALGEYHHGAGKGFYNFLYMTVGTGIGASAMIDGKIVHGLEHSEMGHILIPHDKTKDGFPGCCVYHGDCFEGLACGTAIKARWQVKSALDLPEGHQAWNLEAEYLAAGLMNCILILSPQRIILGGGVMQQQQLFPLVHQKLKAKINNYINLPENLAEYIVSPGLGDRSGVVGAFVIAQQAI